MKKMGELMQRPDTRLNVEHESNDKWTFNNKDITEDLKTVAKHWKDQNFPAVGYHFANALDKSL